MLKTLNLLKLSFKRLNHTLIKVGFPLAGILHAERNFSLSFLISSTREITRQREIPLRAQISAHWKTGLTCTHQRYVEN